MSCDGISALERGYRRWPQRETVALLAAALALTEDQRALFAASARSSGGQPVKGVFASALGRTLGETPNNLPYQTALIGRDDVVAEIKALVREHPLVSLVGAGGVGKTRLALQIGVDLLANLSDGVWVAELASLTETSQVANALASTFGLREREGRPMLDVLVHYLGSRRLLLILDNCEHLIEEAARVADAIRRAAPHVRIISTSRERLRINGEFVYRVPSLALPPSDSLTVEEALRYGAVALFTERAKSSDAAFTLTDEDVPIVVGICRRLDGIALAIELAAARVNVLHPRGLALKLDNRFHVLTGGSRSALPHHQTMRALIDWSHDLLSEPEQRLFRRLAIFVGGWTFEAAEVVCTDDGLETLGAVELLSSLVDKSLVVAEAAEDPRCRFLESTQAFALEKLVKSGERDTLPRRHAQWTADLGDRAHETYWTPPTWHAEVSREVENAHAAIEWALSHDEVILAARILSGFYGVYRRLVGETRVRSHLDAVLAGLDAAVQPALAGRVWNALSMISLGSRRIEAAQHAVELGERSNDWALTALSMSSLTEGLRQTGRIEEAQAVIERGQQLSKEHGLTHSLVYADVLRTAAVIATGCGRFDEARGLLAEALALATALGYEPLAHLSRVHIAELEFRLGNFAEALELVSAMDAEIREQGTTEKQNLILTLVNGAAYRIALDDIPGAHLAARNGLRLARGMYLFYAVIAIQHLATVAARSGDARRCARLRGYVDAWYVNQGNEREFTEQLTYDVLMKTLREKLSDAEIETLAAEGAQLSEDQAADEALEV